MDNKYDLALDRAKVKLLEKNKSIFISSILFSLKQSWDKAIPAAGTDGLSLIINPDWFLTLNEEERVTLLAHESWHVCFEHMLRLGDRDHEIHNDACDHMINLMLIDSGYQMPKKGLARSCFREMSSDQIYDILIKENKPPESDAFGSDILPPNGSPEDTDAIEQKIKSIVTKAALQSEMQGEGIGHLSSDMQRRLKELRNPKINWRVALQDFMTSTSNEDYTYRRPNRRYLPDFYLPTLYSEGLGEIAICVDTSGSVSDEEFACFLSEIAYIQTNLNPSKLTVIDFDTTIKAVHDVTEDKEITDIEFNGYGGTNVTEIIDWGIKNNPAIMVVITDGGFYPYEPDINFPLIWCIVGNEGFTSNIGSIVNMEI